MDLTVQEVVSQDANIFTKLWSRAQPKRKAYLYRYMTDQVIWQSPRFWSAAFFFAVQRERANKPTASWLVVVVFFTFPCLFRSTPPSRPNKVGLKCPSARP